MIELDGRTGEGGGQLVRMAVALSSVTSTPVRITNVRGNRPGSRGGGLKSQHVTAIEWLAEVTGAEVQGLNIGSKVLLFRPRRGPGGLLQRSIEITAESPAASALLIFQAVFPFLLFAGNEGDEPIDLTISGGTNVSFSLSYEYLDQVLLPTLEAWFGIEVERKLQDRGWSSGGATRGTVWFRFQPVRLNTTLKLKEGLDLGKRSEACATRMIDISIIAPSNLHSSLSSVLKDDLAKVFTEATLNFGLCEDSGHESRIYVLLVARTEALRWGRDVLYAGKRKGKSPEALCKEISRSVTRALRDDVKQGGVVDEYLQDQLVIFQALAEGKTSFTRHNSEVETPEQERPSSSGIDQALEKLEIRCDLRKDRVKGPLGDSATESTHTQTARWVASEVLEASLKWYKKGSVCEGMGLRSGC